MSKRFGKKQKRALKYLMEDQKLQHNKSVIDLTSMVSEALSKRDDARFKLIKLEDQIKNFLPKPMVRVDQMTDPRTAERVVLIDTSGLRMRIIDPNLNERSIEFISDQFAELVKHALMKQLIKLKR